MTPLLHAFAGSIGGAQRAYGYGAHGVAAAACGLLLLAISVHDARTGEIPLRYTLGGTAAALVWAGFRTGPAAAGVRALAAGGAALGLWTLARCVGRVARREVMGEGDALLLGFLAIVVGPGRVGTLLSGAATLALAVFAARLLPAPWRAPAVCVAVLLAGGAFVAGGWARLGALALPLAVVWPQRQRVGGSLPFGPMLAAGAVLAFFTPTLSPWPPNAALDTPLFLIHPR
ncbi:MAG TPA: prepilin peptidase [Longimicrobium sp.]|jgi:prepilin signal peptidase PulO-like enzyme (type II secretory pathway)